MCWYEPKRLSTHSRENRKLYDRWLFSTGAGAGVAGATGVLLLGLSVDCLAPFTLDVLLAFSLSLAAGPGLLDFAACLDPPPMKLRKMFHLPLV